VDFFSKSFVCGCDMSFIDYECHLNRHVLNFCNIPPLHFGLLIADAPHKCFRD
jgi:hypothetical protein